MHKAYELEHARVRKGKFDYKFMDHDDPLKPLNKAKDEPCSFG